MKTIYGYDDTEKLLTLEQWENATTEQRAGFLAEGYRLVFADRAAPLGSPEQAAAARAAS